MRIFQTMVLALVLPVLLNGQGSSYVPGEKVNYEIHYGVVQGGVASLEIKADTFRGRDVYHSTLTGKTTGMVDAVFKVKDVYESFIESESELCIFSIRNIREGRYRKYNEVIFDHYSRPDSAILTSDLSGVHVVEKGIHDILSCFYYFRNHHLPNYRNFKRGDIIAINTWFTDELYPIRLRYLGIDEVRTKVGRLKCLKFNPVTEVGRLFKTEDDVSIWFTADKNFLPVKIRFDIFVGSFVAEISSYEGLKYPLEIRRKENN
ncbi:MAG TPA: DUF3108 domain-containing protein [Bacteroidales bacterium]|nr:DUF3108 domain-containing protein [Bacteroidales bacterium]